MIKFYLKKVLRLFSRVFCIFSIKSNRILFLSYCGYYYSCNPKVILEYLLSLNKYDIILVINKRERFILPKAIKTCSSYSLRHIYYLVTSKVYIYNHDVLSFLKRTDQIIINTWHGGGAYKRVLFTPERLHFTYAADFILSSSAQFTKLFLQDDWKFPNTILPIGMPRNDIFFHQEKVQNANIKVREHFNIPANAMLVLYAPTFKESKKSNLYDIDVPRVKATFEKHFSKPIVFAFRMHYIAKENLNASETLDFGTYPDMQELLCASDAVITDYSSLQWDFCHLKRPGFLYCTDIEEYVKERKGTFYTPIETWSFPLAQNNDELEKNILEYDEQKAMKKIQEHLDFLGNYEDGHATEKICSLIEKICFGEGK
jgi:CDP-glycerol glycerophosphotransferase